jgi:hypothetical protein
VPRLAHAVAVNATARADHSAPRNDARRVRLVLHSRAETLAAARRAPTDHMHCTEKGVGVHPLGPIAKGPSTGPHNLALGSELLRSQDGEGWCEALVGASSGSARAQSRPSRRRGVDLIAGGRPDGANADLAAVSEGVAPRVDRLATALASAAGGHVGARPARGPGRVLRAHIRRGGDPGCPGESSNVAAAVGGRPWADECRRGAASLANCARAGARAPGGHGLHSAQGLGPYPIEGGHR